MAREPAAAAVEALRRAGRSVAVAETDTGGLIGSAFTDVPGASTVFQGGVTAYANDAKRTLLHVPDSLLARHGAVSEATVVAMARGVRAALGSTIGLAESGITGPEGGSAERPVGTVWIACVGPGDRVVAEQHRWDGDRRESKERTLTRALQLIEDAAGAESPAPGSDG